MEREEKPIQPPPSPKVSIRGRMRGDEDNIPPLNLTKTIKDKDGFVIPIAPPKSNISTQK